MDIDCRDQRRAHFPPFTQAKASKHAANGAKLAAPLQTVEATVKSVTKGLQ
jgi:hypothetical protein